MTPVFCCGFECGRLGSVGEHWTTSTGFSIDTTIKRSGARSLKTSNVPQNGFISNVIAFSTTALVGRFYVYFDTLPSADTDLFLIRTATLVVAAATFQASDGKIYTRDLNGIGTSVGVSVIVKSWILIDIKGDVSANPWVAEVRVNGISCGQLTRAVAANTITLVALNSCGTANQTHDSYFDDIVISNTSADFPIGNGSVRHFIPTSDGTHNTGTAGTFITGTAGANITNATTTAFQLIDEVPLDDTTPDTNDFINQAANGSTNYTEHIFGPAQGQAPTYEPRAVEAIAVHHQAGTGVGVSSIKLNDNGTENSIVDLNAAGVTTNRYARKHYATAPTGGAWTIVSGAGNFNNIRCRFGYSSDANPDQFFDGIMIEAEFADWPQKVVQIKQAIKRASYI